MVIRHALLLLALSPLLAAGGCCWCHRPMCGSGCNSCCRPASPGCDCFYPPAGPPHAPLAPVPVTPMGPIVPSGK
jgi:hypothetical protein